MSQMWKCARGKKAMTETQQKHNNPLLVVFSLSYKGISINIHTRRNAFPFKENLIVMFSPEAFIPQRNLLI